jgi:hypothetical protein
LKYIWLIIFLSIFAFAIYFAYALFRHLANVLRWLADDLHRLILKQSGERDRKKPGREAVHCVLPFPLKVVARHGIVLFCLTLPQWAFSIGLLVPFVIIWAVHVAADIGALYWKGAPMTRFLQRAARYLRVVVSVGSVLSTLLFMMILENATPWVFWPLLPVLLATAWRRWRWAYPAVVCPILLMAILVTVLSKESDIVRAVERGEQPKWMEVVLFRGLREPECRFKYPPDSKPYQVRSIEFEPDESAVYVAVITDSSRKETGKRFVTVMKLGLRSGVESACWFDRMSIYAVLDASTRRLYVGQRHDPYVRVLDSDSFRLLDTFDVGLDTKSGKRDPIGIQELLLRPENGLLVLAEGPIVALLDRRTGQRLSWFGSGLHSDFAYDSTTDTLYTANYLSPLVTSYSVARGHRLRSGKWGSMSWGVSLRNGTNELYVTDFFLGTVNRLDKRTLRTEWSKRIGSGVRGVLVDECRDALYVGDYATGELRIFRLSDPRKYMIVRTGGARIHLIAQSPVTKQIYLGTRVGLFRVNFNQMRPNPLGLRNEVSCPDGKRRDASLN